MSQRHVEVRPGIYRDSVALMQLSAALSALPTVESALVAMATGLNLELLSQLGFEVPPATGPTDLLVAVAAVDRDALAAALVQLEAELRGPRSGSPGTAVEVGARTTGTAVGALGASTVLVSTPGRYAFVEAMDALDAGASVMVFSDNVPVAHEVLLKRTAAERGLLVLGPDCGTAVIGGVGLGFANVVRPGPVGLVAASGTGAQQVMCLLGSAGVGVSHCLGVGGRDLSSTVGGASTRAALDLLDADPGTELIVVLGKPPAPEVATALRAHATGLATPVLFAPLGLDQPDLTAVTETALARLGVVAPAWPCWPAPGSAAPGGALRGLFSGGTLCVEAMVVATPTLGRIWSNVPVRPEWTLAGPVPPGEHAMVDLGADEYTVGRPHPMLDFGPRLAALAAAGADPACRVVLLDVVLGHGAHPDPAAELAPAVRSALRRSSLDVVVSLVGTADDPQGLAGQAEALRAAGACVFLSNAAAARHAGVPVGVAVTGLLAEPRVVAVGAAALADALGDQAAPYLAVDWRPPPAGTEDDLVRVFADPRRVAANELAVARMLAAGASLVDVRPAAEVVGLAPGEFCHAGPPVDWDRASGPLRGALIGAMLLEGLAGTPEEASGALAAGRCADGTPVSWAPCHDRGGVGPMAGVVSPSMWVWVLRDETHDATAWCTLNEGLGKVLRYGAYAPDVIDRLTWMGSVLGPALRAAVRAAGPLDVKALVGQMVQMGDEGHNRNRAGTLMLLRDLLPSIVESGLAATEVARVARFIGGNDHFFLNLVMPAAKLQSVAAAGIPGSTVVTTLARNGTDFGIQVSGTGSTWYTGPAGTVLGLFLGAYGPDDANPDIGDSAITETVGLGGFAMASAPAIVRFVGGTVADAMRTTQEMYEITVGQNPAYALPVLDFRGAATGIDVTRVVRTGILPQINTGVAGRVAGTGQVGAGLVTPPMECFVAALRGLAAAAPPGPAVD